MPPPASAAPSPPRPRLPALDAARALGVCAMVAGHTLDALLSVEARSTGVMVAYWKARGLTAPLFLLVSGWAVTVAITRSGATGAAAVRARVPRVLLLLAVGYALRWPGWSVDGLLSGDPLVWSHLLAFDALHAIAVALLVAAVVLALPWSAREQALCLGGLAVLAVALGLLPPAPLPPAPSAFPASPLALAAWQAAGGTSPFPLFPWTAYFFAGALVGLSSLSSGAAPGRSRHAAGMAALGLVLVAATAWTGVGTMPPGQPLLVLFRIGVVLLLLAGLSLVPARAAARLAPLGRASLGVYAIHVPLVYGWSTWPGLVQRLGPTRGVLAALGLAAAVLAASLALHHGLVAARGAAARGIARARAAVARRVAGLE